MSAPAYYERRSIQSIGASTEIEISREADTACAFVVFRMENFGVSASECAALRAVHLLSMRDFLLKGWASLVEEGSVRYFFVLSNATRLALCPDDELLSRRDNITRHLNGAQWVPGVQDACFAIRVRS